jgi:hypothetical protein
MEKLRKNIKTQQINAIFGLILFVSLSRIIFQILDSIFGKLSDRQKKYSFIIINNLNKTLVFFVIISSL